MTPDWSQQPSQNRLDSGICSRRRPRSTAMAATVDRVKFGLVLSLCFVGKTCLKTFPRVKPPKSRCQKRRCRFSAFWAQLDLTDSRFFPTMPRRSKFARSVRENGKKATPPQPNCLSQKEIREILDWGFTIVKYGKSPKTFVSSQEHKDFIAEIRDLNDHIFNNATTGKGDGTRLQSVREWDSLPGLAADRISRRIQATFPHLKPGDAQFLLSLADGHDQLPHTDVTAGHAQLKDPNVNSLQRHIQEGRVPLSVIVTFADASKLNIWPGSASTIWTNDDAVKSESEWSTHVTIPPFSALIFRQDLVHSGSNYDTVNLRLHFYMDLVADDYKVEKGHIFYVDRKYWKISKKTRK